MPIQDDLDRIAIQESTLILPAFTPDTAWQIGTLIRDLAIARKYSIVVDVRRFGSPHQQLFYTALEGTTPDNARWVQRKINTVNRMYRSSYSVGLTLALEKISFADRYNLPEADYAAHGGCFPLRVTAAGIVGAVTVSGLPQREDHNLVVEALCLLTGHDHDALKLPS
jgi:uncharacterized protein (UPF0303 family)